MLFNDHSDSILVYILIKKKDSELVYILIEKINHKVKLLPILVFWSVNSSMTN